MNYKFLKNNYIKIILFITIFISSFQIFIIPGIVAPLIFDFLFKDNVELIDQLRKKSSKVCNKSIFLGYEIQSQSIIGFFCDSFKN